MSGPDKVKGQRIVAMGWERPGRWQTKLGQLMLRRVHRRTVNPLPLGKRCWFESNLAHQSSDGADMTGKGHAIRRTSDPKQYASEFDRIFGGRATMSKSAAGPQDQRPGAGDDGRKAEDGEAD